MFLSFSFLQLFPCPPTLSKSKPLITSIVTHTYIRSYIYTYVQPIEPITVVRMYPCLRLTISDEKTYQRACPWKKVLTLLPRQQLTITNPLCLGMGVFLKFPRSELACYLVLILCRSCLENHTFEISWMKCLCHV